MASFLYWNLFGNQVYSQQSRSRNLLISLKELQKIKNIDCFVFSECFLSDSEIMNSLNELGNGTFRTHRCESRRIKFFSRLSARFVGDVYSDPHVEDRIAIQRLQFGRSPDILLVGCHFYDRLRIPTEGGRATRAKQNHDIICKIEDREGHKRTVLVGDLNMNPFESGVAGASGLHAVMTKNLARSVDKLKHRKGSQIFYNPMWHCFGDRSLGAHGSYYYNNIIDSDNFFWNVFDQVLIRPALMDRLVGLEILSSAGSISLVTKSGRPKRTSHSDHLPIFFELSL
jgi:hypothetical protein